MSSIYQKAQAQFAAIRGELVPIDVPEWEAEVWFHPVMTHEEKAAIHRHINVFSGALDADAVITQLIMRGRDQEGKRLWTETARKQLGTEYDPNVLARIAAAMSDMTPQDESPDDRKKK